MTTTSRGGTLTIAGQAFTLTQNSCGTNWLTLTPASRDVGTSGGNFSVTLTAASGCTHMAWAASSNNAWITNVTPASGTVRVLYQGSSHAIIVEMFAHPTNWNDIIEPGSLSVWIPNDIGVDWANIGLYITQGLTRSQVESLPGNASLYLWSSDRFLQQDVENLSEVSSGLIDDGMSFMIMAIDGLAKKSIKIGPAATTVGILYDWLDTYYSDKGWIGDSSSIYPQFLSHGVDAAGNFYGNIGRTVDFAWQPADFFLGFVDLGYQAVALYLPLLNWSSQPNGSIYFFGQFKVTMRHGVHRGQLSSTRACHMRTHSHAFRLPQSQFARKRVL